MGSTSDLTVRPVTTAIGAVIEGVDLRQPLAPETVRFIRQAWLDHSVVFFRTQDLSAEQMRAFAENFGRTEQSQFATKAIMEDANPVTEGNLEKTKHSTAVWHSDTTVSARPPMATALRAVKPPAYGGDTCWSSMYAAYEALSEPVRRMLDTLSAVHSAALVLRRMGAMAKDYATAASKAGDGEHVHPVIRVHPETGRKALFVNEGWTTRIIELTPAESNHLLALLFEHVKSPDFTMRWHWTANDLVLWDNRCVQHYAVPDYSSERIMQRVMLAGDEPFGPSASVVPVEEGRRRSASAA